MNHTLFLTLALILVRSCDHTPRSSGPVTTTQKLAPPATQDSIPACIRKRIEDISKQPVWSPPTEISEYIYKGQTVYLLSADCCDQFTALVDTNCQPLCAPTGGFTGHGDGKCPDFRDSARLVKLVWKDDR